MKQKLWIPLTPPHCCACPKQGPEFPTSYVFVFVCLQRVKNRDEFLFVDIWGIVDHYCLNFFVYIG